MVGKLPTITESSMLKWAFAHFFIFRSFYVLVFSCIAFGVFLHALLPINSEARPDPNQAWFKPFLGWIEAVVVMACVVLLFALFVGFQFHYFFGGQANIYNADIVSGAFYRVLCKPCFKKPLWQ